MIPAIFVTFSVFVGGFAYIVKQELEIRRLRGLLGLDEHGKPQSLEPQTRWKPTR